MLELHLRAVSLIQVLRMKMLLQMMRINSSCYCVSEGLPVHASRPEPAHTSNAAPALFLYEGCKASPSLENEGERVCHDYAWTRKDPRANDGAYDES